MIERQHPQRNTPTCETCVFFHHQAGGSGVCRRHPPRVIQVHVGHSEPWLSESTVWPDVGRDDFCGEHQKVWKPSRRSS